MAALAQTMNGMLDRLQTAATSQRRFVADASHELRSPLATLQAGLDRLTMTPLPGANDDLVRLMRHESQRLGRLIADLLPRPHRRTRPHPASRGRRPRRPGLHRAGAPLRPPTGPDRPHPAHPGAGDRRRPRPRAGVAQPR
ncbi:histidine kinase dimerization/phospho-acceptor domain-containing protein [Micromonospora sp. M12]